MTWVRLNGRDLMVYQYDGFAKEVLVDTSLRSTLRIRAPSLNTPALGRAVARH